MALIWTPSLNGSSTHQASVKLTPDLLPWHLPLHLSALLHCFASEVYSAILWALILPLLRCKMFLFCFSTNASRICTSKLQWPWITRLLNFFQLPRARPASSPFTLHTQLVTRLVTHTLHMSNTFQNLSIYTTPHVFIFFLLFLFFFLFIYFFHAKAITIQLTGETLWPPLKSYWTPIWNKRRMRFHLS